MKKSLLFYVLCTFYFISGVQLYGQNTEVELSAFSLTLVDQEIWIDWSTSPTENTAFYEVERASSDLNFYSIARLESQNGESGTLNYDWRDSKPLQGSNYYRIKRTDSDGNTQVSEAMDIEARGVSSPFEIIRMASSNPILSLVVSNPKQESLSIKITNLSGQILAEHQAGHEQALVSTRISLPELATGVYFAYVKDESGNVIQKKFIKS